VGRNGHGSEGVREYRPTVDDCHQAVAIRGGAMAKYTVKLSGSETTPPIEVEADKYVEKQSFLVFSSSANGDVASFRCERVEYVLRDRETS
jgi:hypothetical protein